MSRFRWSSLYSPTNKSKLAFKFWHPRVHDYCTILCSRPSCVSRNTNKLLQQFLCTSAKNFMLIIGSAPVKFFYFIFLLKTKESASLAWLFLHTGRWPACIESVFYWICGSRTFSLETLLHCSRLFFCFLAIPVCCLTARKSQRNSSLPLGLAIYILWKMPEKAGQVFCRVLWPWVSNSCTAPRVVRTLR